MKKILLVDSTAQHRGFFSTINLTLSTILYCKINQITPIISHSVLSLYGSNASKIRPFSEFFGTAYNEEYSGNTEHLEITKVHNENLLDTTSPAVKNELRMINSDLISQLTPAVLNFINTPPIPLISNFDVSIHYRGSDYLLNTPVGHRPNLQPKEFANVIEKYIAGKYAFLATDDRSFPLLLSRLGHRFCYFKDVYRKGPGRGVHIKSIWQRLGLPALVSQNLKGRQVLRDCIWLSKSNLYIGSNSNLMFYSGLLNPNQTTINLHEYIY
jgi:hypothetical protein